IGLTPSPAGDLAYTMYPWVVSGSRLHHAGWRPKWTNEEVLGELLEEVAGRHTVAGRRLGRKDATVAGAAGAAGATVALLGTAGITAEQALPELFLTADTIGAMMTAGEDRPGAALDAGEHPGDLSTVTMMGATADHILETSATLGLDLALPST
ncbi:hypothetical protein ADL27_24470, partial [Streptomyces sp. NRRL F-6602]